MALVFNLRYYFQIFFDMLLVSVYSLPSYQASLAMREKYID